MTVSLVSLGAIQQAAERVRGVARATPLIPSSSSDEWSHLWIKCENLQVIGAFVSDVETLAGAHWIHQALK